MVNGTGNFLVNAGDFPFQQHDTVLEFVNRQGIKILLDQKGKRIAKPLGEEIIKIHAPEIRAKHRNCQGLD